MLHVRRKSDTSGMAKLSALFRPQDEFVVSTGAKRCGEISTSRLTTNTRTSTYFFKPSAVTTSGSATRLPLVSLTIPKLAR